VLLRGQGRVFRTPLRASPTSAAWGVGLALRGVRKTASRVFVGHFAGAHVLQEPLALVLGRCSPFRRGGPGTLPQVPDRSRQPFHGAASSCSGSTDCEAVPSFTDPEDDAAFFARLDLFAFSASTAPAASSESRS